MTARKKLAPWKLLVKIGLALVLAVDIGLVVVNWQTARNSPRAQAADIQRLEDKQKLLAADVARARDIQKNLPELARDCDVFYQNNLLPTSTGYSTVDAELGQMAASSGVQTSTVAYHEKLVPDRGLSEVTITTTVQGDYSGLIRMLNALERSQHFYILDSLSLASENSGNIKLNMVLRTYFHT